MSVYVYLADEKIMIAIATVVRAAATTPIIINTASNAFSPTIPEHTHTCTPLQLLLL